MTVETVTYIGDLNPALPGAADPKSEGDDHIRNTKKATKNSLVGFTGATAVTGVDGGTANVYTLTPGYALLAYGLRMTAEFSPAAANTGACSLNISGLGAQPLRSVSGAELVTGDLIVGSLYKATYNGTEFRLDCITKNYSDQQAVTATLPGQAGNGGKFLRTDGSAATWALPIADQTGQAGKVLTTDGTATSWMLPSSLPRSARTANTILGTTDRASLIDITSGTFTQTFAAAATLGSGWWVWLRNSGTGIITLDPNASELIAGATTLKLYPGDTALVQCDGSALNLVTADIRGYQEFALSGNFTTPLWAKTLFIEEWSGGEGGTGGTVSSNGGKGGAGGNYLLATMPATPGSVVAVTVGSGGAGGAAGGGAGGASNPSTFGVYANSITGVLAASTAIVLMSLAGTAGGAGGSGGTAGSPGVSSTSGQATGGGGGGSANAGASGGVGGGCTIGGLSATAGTAGANTAGGAGKSQTSPALVSISLPITLTPPGTGGGGGAATNAGAGPNTGGAGGFPGGGGGGGGSGGVGGTGGAGFVRVYWA